MDSKYVYRRYFNYVTSTDGNIGIGLYAGHYMRGGTDNIFIGRYSGFGGVEVSNYTSVNYNIGIGFKTITRGFR